MVLVVVRVLTFRLALGASRSRSQNRRKMSATNPPNKRVRHSRRLAGEAPKTEQEHSADIKAKCERQVLKVKCERQSLTLDCLIGGQDYSLLSYYKNAIEDCRDHLNRCSQGMYEIKKEMIKNHPNEYRRFASPSQT